MRAPPDRVPFRTRGAPAKGLGHHPFRHWRRALQASRVAKLAIGFALLVVHLLAGALSVAHSARLLDSGPDESLAALLAAVPGPADLVQLTGQFRELRAPWVVANDSPPHYAVGRVDRFWVGHSGGQEPREVEAELRLVSHHAYWYVQRGYSVADEALQDAASAFETRIYPEVRRLIGSEPFPGLDNDPRVTILHADLTGVAGYVSSGDGYPQWVHRYSNEREMVYLNIHSDPPGTMGYLRTLAHEFTHLVQAGDGIMEDTWVKEGLAELVARMVLEEKGQRRPYPIMSADLPLTSWADADDQRRDASAHYRMSELFFRYLVDRFGVGTLERLNTRAGLGFAGWDSFFTALGVPGGFVGFFDQWVVANVVGTHSGPGVSAYREPAVELTGLRPLRSGDAYGEQVAQFGTDYYELPDPWVASTRFQGDPIVSLLSASAADVWVAARADGAVAHLTCTLDLSGSTSATLVYRVWYDIERDYDFAYVAVAPDDERGQWTLLRTPEMTTVNRVGWNLGVGYTGKSGGGAQPRWVEEHVGLGAYAGRRVSVRFTYVTDDAVSREGIGVEQIRLLAGDRSDENPCHSWSAQGWARVGAVLPQRWLVRVIVFDGDGVRVHALQPDHEGRAFWSGGGDRIDRAVLAVSAATPGTLQPASYRLIRE